MYWLTEDAVLKCDHGGRLQIAPTQTLVRIAGRRPLVDDNPEQRGISHCPNNNPLIGLLPCVRSLTVKEGYSTLLRIEGRAVCLDSVRGLAHGSPPGVVNYTVKQAGQAWVEATT